MEASEFSMNCEQVEALVFDLEREGGADPAERTAALAHLAKCPRCAALQESWQAARAELTALAEETLAARAPERVEMRLRHEFRTQHGGWKRRRTAVVAAWALATAAVLAGAISVRTWQHARWAHGNADKTSALGDASAAGNAADQGSGTTSAETGNSNGDDTAEFTPLPGTTLDDSEEAAILRVRMQRGSLGALGFPVNEQRAADWIQVDMLVGADGLPQAVRLAQEEN